MFTLLKYFIQIAHLFEQTIWRYKITNRVPYIVFFKDRDNFLEECYGRRYIRIQKQEINHKSQSKRAHNAYTNCFFTVCLFIDVACLHSYFICAHRYNVLKLSHTLMFLCSRVRIFVWINYVILHINFILTSSLDTTARYYKYVYVTCTYLNQYSHLGKNID